MIRKTAYSVMMAYDVPESDKKIAEQASIVFQRLDAMLERISSSLDILYNPMKENPNIPSSETIKYRAYFRKFRDQVVENFNKIKKQSLISYNLMNNFSTDAQINDLMSSFTSNLEDVEKQVKRFADIFSNLASPDFQNNTIVAIENIKKQISQLIQLIRDRILEHINTNILAKNWVTDISNEFQIEIDKKLPKIIQLYNERNKIIDEAAGINRR